MPTRFKQWGNRKWKKLLPKKSHHEMFQKVCRCLLVNLSPPPTHPTPHFYGFAIKILEHKETSNPSASSCLLPLRPLLVRFDLQPTTMVILPHLSPSDNPGLNSNIQHDDPAPISPPPHRASIPRAIFQGSHCSNDTSLRTQHMPPMPEQVVLSHAEFDGHATAALPLVAKYLKNQIQLKLLLRKISISYARCVFHSIVINVF